MSWTPIILVFLSFLPIGQAMTTPHIFMISSFPLETYSESVYSIKPPLWHFDDRQEVGGHG
jgi:hypothetical protein